ncbi:MAG TPA: aminotransferase class I/II-fold pyridoxal phosphate-dependent enzyme [Elusimicrobiota bacterium]|nr:aminotransferase class I/II-fold pyridoxal phosphate-dependent enzyme [Elusimicrobiota bacterium]
MTDTKDFADHVLAEAQKLRDNGLDANQIAGILCKKDPGGKNYGIGIILDSNGNPLPTSPTLLEYLQKEIQESGSGVYVNSDALKADMLDAVLEWQGVPKALKPHFQLLLPSDAGTGAVQTGIQVALTLHDGFRSLAVEELGWPAYKALAAAARLRFQEFASDGTAEGDGVLPLYQAGPLNTTGKVPSPESVQNRVRVARASGAPVVLDRAYPGFEFARRLADGTPHAQVMQESFRAQVLPFVEAEVPFCMAISPTKAFVTFSLRPCGMLLVFLPDPGKAKELGPKLSGVLRARGSSFEHPVSRAFVKAMVRDRSRLEAEHARALRRCAEAEKMWHSMAKGTPIEALFSDSYAGLFRNPRAKPEAPRTIYGAHLYPVFTEGRCRLNVTGLPADAAEARSQVSFFAQYCC